MEDRITIDFETKSNVSVMDVGAWIYSKDPSTEVLCLVYKIPGCDRKLWKEGDEPPYALFDAIEDEFENYYIEAHNSFFELCIWMNVCVKKYGWIELPASRMKCSAAKAAAHALPRALDKAGEALDLKIQKDPRGKFVLGKLSQPQKPTKKDPRTWINKDDETPIYSKGEEITPQQLFQWLYEYCDFDVAAEEELSSALDDLTPTERLIFLHTQLINWRGIYIDYELVEAALFLLDKFEVRVKQDLVELTNGYVDAPTKRDDMLFYCYTEGYELPNLTADTIEKTLEKDDVPPKVRKLLNLRQLGGKASIKKFAKFKIYADPDDHRCRDSLMYHGASTGRWAGKGIQPQNLPKGSFKSIDEIEECIALIKERDIDKFTQRYEDPADALSSVVRSIMMATPGHDMFCADYSAIEARVIVWLASDENALELFHAGKDIYIDMALTIFGITQDDYDSEPKEKQTFMRGVGKDAILGLGYGMGWRRYQREAFRKGGQKLTDSFCETVVDKYRSKYESIVNLWYGYEKAAMHAVKHQRTKDKPCKKGRVKWYMHNGFLCAELPSGRCLYYYQPKIKQTEFYGRMKDTLTFMGVHPKSKQWVRLDTYGGHLTENICQAVARDIMSAAALEAEDAGYKILTSVHDELVAERKEGTGSVEEYEAVLSKPPKWASNCPIAAEGWKGKRYRK